MKKFFLGSVILISVCLMIGIVVSEIEYNKAMHEHMFSNIAYPLLESVDADSSLIESDGASTNPVYDNPDPNLDLLGFANYCLELHIIEPRLADIQRYREQGGWAYYLTHIINADK